MGLMLVAVNLKPRITTGSLLDIELRSFKAGFDVIAMYNGNYG